MISPRYEIIAGMLVVAQLLGCAHSEREPQSAPAVPVLIYHEVVIDGKAPGETVISLDRFAEQMQYLDDNGYHPIGLNQLVSFMRSGDPLPSRPVVLTFDDGWKSVLNTVPVLDKHGFKASFWIITGDKGIGGDYLDWADIQSLAMHKDFEVESHTVSHPWNPASNLVTWVEGRTPGKGLGDARRELEDSKRALEERLGRPINYLAWPCGWYDDTLIALAQEAGYKALLTAESGLNRQGDNPLNIKRTFIDGACDLEVFARTVRDGHHHVCQTTRPTMQGHLPDLNQPQS